MLELNQKKSGRAIIVTLKGDLNTESAPEASARFEELIEKGEADLVVDLTGVDHLNAAGLQEILKLGRKVNQVNGRLFLCGLNDYVQEVFDTTSLSSVFSITETAEEAVAQY